jgi:predicted  nucleic acid-binding Zn-ribbon protein
MGDTKDLKAALQQELERLTKIRDDVRVQLSLAKAEVEDEWNRLEGSWDRIHDEIKRVGEHSKEPAQKLGSAASQLLDELKRGYERIRAQLKP